MSWFARLLLSSTIVAGALAALQASSASQGAPLPATQSDPRPAPAWSNASWLSVEQPVSLASLRDRVVLLNFWVFTCYNCTNTVPSLVRLDEQYRDRGLTIIGIHTPEFPPYAGEHDRANVARALTKYHIQYANAQDNDRRTWNLYGIRYWPSFVLIDKSGTIRHEGAGEFHVGDRNHQRWEQRIRSLLDE